MGDLVPQSIQQLSNTDFIRIVNKIAEDSDKGNVPSPKLALAMAAELRRRGLVGSDGFEGHEHMMLLIAASKQTAFPTFLAMDAINGIDPQTD